MSLLNNALKTHGITFRLNELLHFNIYNANIQIKSQKAVNLQPKKWLPLLNLKV